MPDTSTSPKPEITPVHEPQSFPWSPPAKRQPATPAIAVEQREHAFTALDQIADDRASELPGLKRAAEKAWSALAKATATAAKRRAAAERANARLLSASKRFELRTIRAERYIRAITPPLLGSFITGCRDHLAELRADTSGVVRRALPDRIDGRPRAEEWSDRPSKGRRIRKVIEIQREAETLTGIDLREVDLERRLRDLWASLPPIESELVGVVEYLAEYERIQR